MWSLKSSLLCKRQPLPSWKPSVLSIGKSAICCPKSITSCNFLLIPGEHDQTPAKVCSAPRLGVKWQWRKSAHSVRSHSQVTRSRVACILSVQCRQALFPTSFGNCQVLTIGPWEFVLQATVQRCALCSGCWLCSLSSLPSSSHQCRSNHPCHSLDQSSV